MMTRCLLPLLICVFATSTAHVTAQNHLVELKSTGIVDSTSGNDLTTIVIGTTVEWSDFDASGVPWLLTGQDGISATIPVGGTATHTFSNLGLFTYTAALFPFLNFTGTVLVLPPPSPNYPGTGEDLQLEIANFETGTYSLQHVTSVAADDFVGVRISSPGGTFWGENYSVLATLMVHVPNVTVVPAFPINIPGCSCGGLYVQTSGPLPSTTVIWGAGTLATISQPALLQPTGDSFAFEFPGFLVGIDILFQGLVTPGGTTNPFFVTTDAKVLDS